MLCTEREWYRRGSRLCLLTRQGRFLLGGDMTLPKRKATRLKAYDYSLPGYYFITLCVQDRRCILSEISVGEGLAPPVVRLTGIGKLAEEQLQRIPERFTTAAVEKYVIMPNHIHLILRMKEGSGGASPSPIVTQVVGVFKSDRKSVV